MHRLFRIKAYEAEHGPHFDEEMARKAVSKMENEDGSRGQHWSIEETTSLANQHGIRMDEKFNKYDWYVALNMVYSDYYRVIVNMTNSNNPKHFVELAKAWLCDKDIEEGKMWYYYVYIMCDKIRNAEEELFPFFPFPGTGFNRRRRLNRISGIPVLKTTGVTASTTEVRYDVNEEEWRALPNEGLFFLDVRQEVPTASADLPVTLKAEESTSDSTSMLRSALAEDV